MAIEMEALIKAVIEDLNSNYKTISELSKEMGYSTPVYLIRKAKVLKLGLKIKNLVLLSPKEQEILKNSINRRLKEGD